MTKPDQELKSERLLNEIKRRSRENDVLDVEDERVKIVIFTSGETRYAFYGADIREILSACEISWVPGLPEYLPGLINVRGDIESVVDMRLFLGGKRSDPKKCLIVMAVRGNFRSGILVDSMEDVVDIPLNAIKPPLATLGGITRELAAGEVEHGGGVITLLDVEKTGRQIELMSGRGEKKERSGLNMLFFSARGARFAVDAGQVAGTAAFTGEPEDGLPLLYGVPLGAGRPVDTSDSTVLAN